MKRVIFAIVTIAVILISCGIACAQLQVGGTITFGHYEQDNNLSNGTEAIEWQILAVEKGRALLLSKFGLDMQQYNTARTEITWEKSSLRAWLNSEFYNSAFSNEEREQIMQVTNNNPDNPGFGTKGGNPTQDRLFLLSSDEAYKYLPTDASRQGNATKYAIAKGALVHETYGYSWWWLRSPGTSGDSAIAVIPTGYPGALTYVDDTGAMVRPAFWLNLAENGAEKDRSSKTDSPAHIQSSSADSEMNYNIGYAEYKKHNYAEALRYLKASSDAGNPEAQYLVGWMYDQGQGVPRSYPIAAEYYELAAAQGHPKAQFSLGWFYNYYNFGQDMNTTYEKAAYYYKLAADQGHDDAQYRLGWLYDQGLGVPKSYPIAAKYYELAAAQGNVNAQFSLGWFYHHYNFGQDMSTTYEKAAYYYKLAADQGHNDAQYRLGWLYDQGQGVPKSYPKAAEYYQLAAAQGNLNAQFSLGWFYNFYNFGQDMSTTYEKAAYYYQLAADQGHSDAMYRLGELYYSGTGVPRSFDMAIKYFQLAADNNHDTARKRLEELKK